MNEQLRIGIKPHLVKEATQIFDELGITRTAAVSMFFAQVVKVRGLPFRPSEFPALDEYGATLEQATAAEKAALAEMKTEGTTVFTGKIW